jgi:hypothetical protein
MVLKKKYGAKGAGERENRFTADQGNKLEGRAGSEKSCYELFGVEFLEVIQSLT